MERHEKANFRQTGVQKLVLTPWKPTPYHSWFVESAKHLDLPIPTKITCQCTSHRSIGEFLSDLGDDHVPSKQVARRLVAELANLSAGDRRSEVIQQLGVIRDLRVETALKKIAEDHTDSNRKDARLSLLRLRYASDESAIPYIPPSDPPFRDDLREQDHYLRAHKAGWEFQVSTDHYLVCHFTLCDTANCASQGFRDGERAGEALVNLIRTKVCPKSDLMKRYVALKKRIKENPTMDWHRSAMDEECGWVEPTAESQARNDLKIAFSEQYKSFSFPVASLSQIDPFEESRSTPIYPRPRRSSDGW
jgi:hypothetical protein